MERTREAMLTCLLPAVKAPRVRTEVVAFADWRDLYDTGIPNARVVSSPPFGRLIVYAPTAAGMGPEILPHELAHDLSRWFMPIQPTWLSEGFATYMQSIRVSADGRTARAGIPPSWVLRVAGSRRVPIDELHANDRFPSYGERGVELYASSWLLVSHLLNAHESSFSSFATALSRLEDWRGAWKDSFPPAEVLERELKERLVKPKYLMVTCPVDPQDAAPSVRSLSPAEVQGLRARIILGTLGPAQIGPEVDKALALDPNELTALAIAFYYLSRSSEERAAIAKRASDAHPDAGLAWLMAAEVAKDPDVRRDAFNRAGKLLPYHAGVRQRIALEKIRRGQAADALADTTLALRAGGATSVELLRAHVVALAANRRCQAMHRLLANDIPGWSPERLEEIRTPLTPEEAWCAEHPEHEASTGRLQASPIR